MSSACPPHPDDSAAAVWIRGRVAYRDGSVIVIDKPAGMAVHAGPKGGVVLEDYLHHLAFGLPQPPRLAHRLDRDTSGCLLLGRHDRALRRLGRQFEQRRIDKVYWAIVHGRPPEPEGRINLRLSKRSTQERGWWMEVSDDGREAVTRYREVASANERTLLELVPETGRTHQLRVHLAAISCPIVGDQVYGGRKTETVAVPLRLHARSIGFVVHKAPSIGQGAGDAERVTVHAEPPPSMRAEIDLLRSTTAGLPEHA